MAIEHFTSISQSDIKKTDVFSMDIIKGNHRAIFIKYVLAYDYSHEQGLPEDVIDLCQQLAIYISEQSVETNRKHEKAKESHKSLRDLALTQEKLNPKVGAVLLRAKEGSNTCEIFACCRGAFDFDNHAEHSLIFHVLGSADNVKFTQDDYFFTTLEPCTQNARNKWSRACAKILEEREIQHLYVGIMDPNVLITGRGYFQLFKSGKDHPIEIIPFRHKYRKIICENNIAYLSQFDREKPLHLEACRDIFLAYEKIFNFDAIRSYIQLKQNEPVSFEDEDLNETLLSIYFFLVFMLMRKYIVPSRDGIDPYSLSREFALFFCDRPKDFVDGATIRIHIDGEPFLWDGPLSLFFDWPYFIKGGGDRESLIAMLLRKYGGSSLVVEWQSIPNANDREDKLKAWLKTINLDLEAFREAVLNALVHRDYDSGIFTEIHLNDSEIIIKSPLPKGLSAEKKESIEKMNMFSDPTYPMLMRLFMDTNSTERRGYGMQTFRQHPGRVKISVQDEPYLNITFLIDGLIEDK